MSADAYRRQLARKQKQRVDAEKKAGDFRARESMRRSAAAKARQAAAKKKPASTAASKLREASRREDEAASAGKDAAAWSVKAARYAKEETELAGKLAKAEQAEAVSAQKKAARATHRSDLRAAAARRAMEDRLTRAEAELATVPREFPAPKPEKLRVLLLGASSDGGLRVGREQARIRRAVESALHRESIELDARPAATTDDLLDGITKFRPHVIHFSGHSNSDLLVFEEDEDSSPGDLAVGAAAFARAVRATDDQPLLVLLNSCSSAPQAGALVESVVPFAIGMADSIGDRDAIAYAAHFYAAVANGQSIGAAHAVAQVALELAGLDGAELPMLVSTEGADPHSVKLVEGPKNS